MGGQAATRTENQGSPPCRCAAQHGDEDDSPPSEGNSSALGWQTGVGSKLGKLFLIWTHPCPPEADVPSVGGDLLGRLSSLRWSLQSRFCEFCSKLIFVAACLALPAWGDVKPPVLKTLASPTVITIGDRVKCKLEVEHAAADKIEFPDYGNKSDDWTLSNKQQLPQEKTTDPDWVRDSAAFEVAIYKVGDQELPSLTVEVRSPDGRQTTLHSDPLKITVQSILTGGSKELKEIKSQVELPRDYQWLIFLAGGLAGLGVIGWLIYWWMKRRKKNRFNSAAPSRPADELAREAIRILLAKELAAKGLFKEFYLELSEILKKYLGIKLQVISLERTTEEFVADLESTPLSWRQIRDVQEFLADCDLVKFAKYHPVEDEVSRIVQRALEIVDTTERNLLGETLTGPEGKP
jgi:hypothetical protein